MRCHRLVPVVMLVLSQAAAAVAQADRTDEFVRAEMERQRIPGLSLVVLRDGKVVKAAGYGLADRSRKIPATPETVYKIGSVSKQFIATGIMLLVQERQLGLEDPIGKFLDAVPAAWKSITIRHLLTHTSGIVREAPGFDPFKIQRDIDVIKSAYAVPLRFAPGEKYEYSNTGYFALAEVIQRVSGRPWHEFLHERVFAPAGMNATRTTTTTEHVANRAAGYSDNDRLADAADWPAVRPSGAFLSTVLDLAKWDALLNTSTILNDASRRQMWTAATLNDGSRTAYGFGWELGSVKGHRNVHHGGGLPGFQSEFARFVDDGLTVAVLINLDDADVESIAIGVAALYLPAKGGDDRNGAYDAVADWWKPAPEHDATWTWGEVSGLAADSPDRIIVAVWGDRNRQNQERPDATNYLVVVERGGGRAVPMSILPFTNDGKRLVMRLGDDNDPRNRAEARANPTPGVPKQGADPRRLVPSKLVLPPR